MKSARLILFAAIILSLISCRPLSTQATSRDCTVAVAPAGFTRLFIGFPATGSKQSGVTAGDPLDGSTADKFDTILRTIAEGEQPTWGTQKNIAPENLIVCMTSGTFQTNGQNDWVIDVGHTLGAPRGFTVEKNWKIHGNGINQTRLQLASYLPNQYIGNNGSLISGGYNTIIGTHSDEASGVEISDLTIDANHDQLTPINGPPLNLAAIALQSTEGKFWAHDLTVIGASNDVGFLNISYEDFAVRITGRNPVSGPYNSMSNLVENITVSNPGRPMASNAPAGGAMDGIVVDGAVAEIRKNTVEDYYVGYGGWNMAQVNFHDNISKNTYYGFNADALSNNSVTLASNQFIHPVFYGIVVGGGGIDHTFANWTISNNTIQLNTENALGIILQGQVSDSTFSQNTIQSDGVHTGVSFYSYSFANGLHNLHNNFQSNHIDSSLQVNFSRDPDFNMNCRNQNRDLQGQPLPGFPDNSNSQCN